MSGPNSQWNWKQVVAEQALDIVNSQGSLRFRLDDLYQREHVLQQRFPRNRYVREKIRQTLQRLRDMGFLSFQGDGVYEVDPQFDDLEMQSNELAPIPTAPKTRTVVRTIRLRNTLLAGDIKRRYDHHCQVCQETIPLRDRGYSEAHHLKPLGAPHQGPDTEGNIIVVCPNHHVMFDRGALCIDPRTLTVTHITGALEPRRLFLASWHELDARYLVYHSLRIYGQQ